MSTAIEPHKPSTAPAPTGGGGLIPAGNGAPTPARLPIPANRPGPALKGSNSSSRELARPAGGNVALNLAGYSNLDEIMHQMTALNGELQILNEGLAVLKSSSTALDAIIANMDELGKMFEAPASTRSALDADSTVAAAIDEMVGDAQRHGHNTQVLNAQAFLALRAVIQVQENQRAMGAGPRLLASSGRL